MVDPLEPLNRKELVCRLAFAIVTFSLNMMKNNITPVWCWDGQSPPEKAYIREKRRDAKQKLRERIRLARETLLSHHPLARTSEMLLEYKKLICQDTTVSPPEMQQLQEFASNIGLPSLKAKGEAEKLCAALALEGTVKGVWSDDTDAYALGTPLLITGFAGPQSVSVVSLQHILNGMKEACGWDFGLANMIDMCIMHGTDFNPNMSGIGPAKSFKLIKKYGSIENVAAYEPTKPVAVLNHIRVRQIFEYEPSGYRNPNVSRDLLLISRDILETCGCQDLYTELVGVLSCVSASPERIKICPFVGVKGPQDFVEEQAKPVVKSRLRFKKEVEQSTPLCSEGLVAVQQPQ